MLYAGLDLSRQRLDVRVLDAGGRSVEVTAVRPDADSLRTLVGVIGRHGQPVSAAIESMTGARFVHDQLELLGWDVAIADALKVKSIAPLAAKTRLDRWRTPVHRPPALDTRPFFIESVRHLLRLQESARWAICRCSFIRIACATATFPASGATCRCDARVFDE